MPAVSKQQQKLFGLALAFKRGEIEASEVSDEVQDIADRMSEKDIEDFAATKHKELPKMKEQLRKIVREIMRERVISELTEENPCWKGYKQLGMKTKDGKKVPNCVKESVNEASRISRGHDFYGDDDGTKHGKAIHSLLKGKWNSKKVENYLEKLGGGNDVKHARIIDFISKDAGLNPRKYKTLGEQLPALIKQLKVLYKDFHKIRIVPTDSLDEGKPKIKNTISKKDWSKLHKSSKHIGSDGTHYIMKYDDKIGTHLQAVKLVNENLSSKRKKKSITEGKFKKDDLVYNKRTKTVGIVRLGDDKYGEVKTDADGNVDVDELEKYNPIKFKHQTKAKVAPSTEKEVSKRGLFNPFKNESVVTENNRFNTLDDFEKDAKIGTVFYLGSEDQFKRASKKDYYKIIGKKTDGSLIVNRGTSKKKYTIGADRYDEPVIIVKESVVNEARKVSKPIKVDDDTMVQIVGDDKGFRELTAALNPKTGKPIQKFGFDRGNEIANSKEELIKKLQKKYGKSIKFESVVNEAKNINWAEFYKMAKDTSGDTLTQFEKKYGSILDRPHVKDALKNTKNFKSFMKHINKFESVVNEAKKFGNWSVTREDENQIKLVNQNTLDDLYVHKSKGKFEISYKGKRIIKPSLKQIMVSVLKLD